MGFHPDIKGALGSHLAPLQSAPTLLVAYSGGLDSTVLLHAIAQIPEIKSKIKAVHVHHQLSPQAGDWLLHCQKTAARLGVTFTSLTVSAKPKKGESPEAAARVARYNALRTEVQKGDYLLAAHHLDDQLETVLLQLFRGAGLKGLSGMRVLSSFGSGFLLRPFLGLKRSELENHAREQALTWIEDESNRELGFDRNFLRHQVIPILKSRWPEISKTVARASRHCLDADELITEECPLPLALLSAQTLSVESVRKLAPLWQRYVLRQWILDAGFLSPSSKKLEQIIQTVVHSAWDGIPCVGWKGAEIRRFRDSLHLMQPLPAHDATQVFFWKTNEKLLLESLKITITKAAFEASGVDFTRLKGPFTIRFRQGGEKCLLPGHAHHTALKKFFQVSGVPPWLRDRIPLLFEGDVVIGILGEAALKHELCT